MLGSVSEGAFNTAVSLQNLAGYTIKKLDLLRNRVQRYGFFL